MSWLKWGAFTLVLAAIVHWTTVAYAPTLIMSRAMSTIAASTKGTNTIGHGERSTAASRTIVLPSPDLLYSTCTYDVSRRPLKITTAPMLATRPRNGSPTSAPSQPPARPSRLKPLMILSGPRTT